MSRREITGTPSQVMVEQLRASGVTKVFYNSGSREAPFFDALHETEGIDGILALHEGSVTAMTGGYTQVRAEPGVMVVHLGAGLAQCLGQLINVAAAGLPVVVITFAADTGSFGDVVSLDLDHNFSPTSISGPFTKASWAVIEAEGLPAAIERALRVATTPPMGPVHLAVYDRLLEDRTVTTEIIDGPVPRVRGGLASDDDLEALARTLHDAERPLIYAGDGVWKSGAEEGLRALAERFGAPVALPFGDLRGLSAAHPLYLGRVEQASAALRPDRILCVGVRHGGAGRPGDYAAFAAAESVAALGSDPAALKNIPGLSHAVLADEGRTLEALLELTASESTPDRYDDRRRRALALCSQARAARRAQADAASPQPGTVRPTAMLDALDAALEAAGGGLVTTEQFAAPLDCVLAKADGGANVYVRPASGSEGYGVGAPVGAKLAAPDKPVAGVVGDGSLYYADSGLYTAAHHRIPVLYLIANNGAYGIVAGAFSRAGGAMSRGGEYAGVRLDGIDPVSISQGFGVEAERVDDEAAVADAIRRGLSVTANEGRPYLLNVVLPTGLPAGARPAHALPPGRLVGAVRERPARRADAMPGRGRGDAGARHPPRKTALPRQRVP